MLGEPLTGQRWLDVITRSFRPRSDDGMEVSLHDGRRVQLAGVIVDKNCKLPDGFRAGQDAQADLARGLHRTPQGVTLVTAEMLGQAPGSG